MTAANPLDVLQVPGRLVKSPTDLTAAYPYGGTELGFVNDTAIVVNQRYETVLTDEYGLEVVDVQRQRSTATLGFILRQWDEDVYSEVFAAANVNQSFDRILGNGYSPASALLASRGLKLLFVPDDLEMPAFIAYNAVPCLDQTATLNFQLDAELNIAMIFYLLRNTAGTEAYQVGRLRDLELSP